MQTTQIYNTLCTPFDVLRYSTVNGHTDTARFCNAIKRQEEGIFNACLGRDFYKSLLADKKQYTYSDFQTGIVYPIGTIVLYFGILYEVTQATTGVEIPSVATAYFTEAARFNNVAYNTLFNDYLAELIALLVAANSIIPSSIEFTSQGAVRKEGDGFRAADTKDLGNAKQQLIDSANLVQNNMNVFILENKADYPLYLPLQNSCINKKCNPSSFGSFGNLFH